MRQVLALRLAYTFARADLTKEALDAGLANLGINWTTTNFNTTPSV